MAHVNSDKNLIQTLRDPLTDACSRIGTLGIREDGTLWRYTGAAAAPWVQIFGPPALGSSFWSVAMCESLNLAVLGSAVHYIHVTEAANLRAIAMALNGTTINSAAPVDVDLAIVGGAALGTVSLANGATAGQGASVTINPVIAIPAGSVISATVSAQATVAGGSGSVSLGLYLA